MMDKNELDKLWEQVEHVGKIDHLGYDAMVSLGSVFGKMRKVILEQQEDIKQLETELMMVR
jgi:hypothetical protein